MGSWASCIDQSCLIWEVLKNFILFSFLMLPIDVRRKKSFNKTNRMIFCETVHSKEHKFSCIGMWTLERAFTITFHFVSCHFFCWALFRKVQATIRLILVPCPIAYCFISTAPACCRASRMGARWSFGHQSRKPITVCRKIVCSVWSCRVQNGLHRLRTTIRCFVHRNSKQELLSFLFRLLNFSMFRSDSSAELWNGGLQL